MTVSYSSGSITAGSFVATSAKSGSVSNGTTTLGTVPAGKTWYIIAANLTAVHDNLGTTAAATIAANSVAIISVPTSANQTATDRLTLMSGYAFVLTTGQTVTLSSPSSDITAYGTVTFIEI